MAMIQLPPDFKEFLKLLNANRVKYLLIGGYAVHTMAFPELLEIWTFGWIWRKQMPKKLFRH